MKKKLLCFFILIFFSLVCFSQTNNDIDTVLNRYKNFLLFTDTSFQSVNDLQVINKDGKWPDINYENNQTGAWQVSVHLQRVRDLALAWASVKSTDYHSLRTKQTISLALADWFKHRYKSKNWWHNEIGVPQIMRDIIVLMADTLSNDERRQALEILAQYKVAGTGANLVWSADLGLHYGALTENWALMKQCRDTILTVIKVTTDEGVQPDYSFHQHGKRLQMYHYGGAFLRDDVRIAWQLRNLSLAFPFPKINILTQFVLNGWQWMARGINTVPGTIDRAASRKNALHSADIRNIMPFLYEIQPDSIEAFKKLYAIQNNLDALNGYKYYPYADFTAYHQPKFSFFLKTNSTRTLLTESINRENLKGELLNSGDSYFISQGNEYFNLMPVWDWDRLPGITNFISDRKNKIKQQSFTGNVSDGRSGLAVMDYYLQKDDQSLKAHKFWATDGIVTVALIAGLKTQDLEQPAFTVLDQARWSGEVTVNRPGNILTAGTFTYKDLKWMQHRNFVYIPAYKDSIVIKINETKGQWSSINESESGTQIADSVFMPSIIHAAGKDYSGYIVAYAPAAAEAEKLFSKPSWQILQNNDSCQAVQFANGKVMASFYKPGKIRLRKGLDITVNHPCLILLKSHDVYFSDPGHTGGRLSATINNQKVEIELPADGTTVRVYLPSIK